MMQLMLKLASELLHRVISFVACALSYGQGKADVSQLKAVILSTALAETHVVCCLAVN